MPDALYLCIGQSNMIGYNRSPVLDGRQPASAPPAAEKPIRLSKLRLWTGYGLRALPSPFLLPDEATFGLPNLTPTPGHGPLPSFADQIRRKHRLNPAFLLCARNGHGFASWSPGSIFHRKMLRRLMHGMTELPLAGVLVQIGETDAATADDAEQWQARVRDLLSEVRSTANRINTALGRAQTHIPVTLARLGRLSAARVHSGDFPYWDCVARQQQESALPGVTIVETSDLPREPDGLHFSATALDELGRRFVDATPPPNLLGYPPPEPRRTSPRAL
ncbi:MAG: sialate O-acetylesterase [Pseudomonadota bacterium]